MSAEDMLKAMKAKIEALKSMEGFFGSTGNSQKAEESKNQLGFLQKEYAKARIRAGLPETEED